MRPGGRRIAPDSRKLRRAGIAVRKTIDPVIATRCIRDRNPLLHDDGDFEPFSSTWRCVRCAEVASNFA